MPSQSTIFESKNYMVPEFLNNEYCDYCCDIWQLGVLLYGLIENKLPTLEEIQAKKKFETTRLPELTQLVEACLQYDTSKRP
jgi:serine/threonine protein kinase